MAFFVFILGLVIGSFLNVLIDRIPRGEKLTGRSHCESCGETLTWKELIPVVSFLWLRGKCRFCKAELSYQYPLVELLTGILFLISYLSFTIYHLPFGLFVISILIVIFVTDLKYGIIPDKIIFPSIFVSFIFLFINRESLFINHFVSAVGSFAFFYFLYLITKKRGIGFGDVKFAFLIGLMFGFPSTVYVLYIAFLTGGIVGTILVLWKKKNLKTSVPFGPFLVIGCLITLFLITQIQSKVNQIF